MVMTEIGSHWPTSFGLCGLYLISNSVVKLPENLVDCEVLLDDRVMAIGHGLAYSYYYGFLRIILPATENSQSIALNERFSSGKKSLVIYQLILFETLGIRDRASHFEFEEKIQLASKKMLILIPDMFLYSNFPGHSKLWANRASKSKQNFLNNTVLLPSIAKISFYYYT